MQAVKMYTTAVCPYCIRAKQLLISKGVAQIEEIRIDSDAAARAQALAAAEDFRDAVAVLLADSVAAARPAVVRAS